MNIIIKHLISLACLLLFAVAGMAQSYNITFDVSTQKPNCYTDGKVIFKLGGADLGLLTASDQISLDVLKDGSSYRQHDLTYGDIIDSVFTLESYPSGNYLIDYSIWIKNQEHEGTTGTFRIEANEYRELFVFQSLGDIGTMHGTRPTLTCQPTGRIQLEIVQGKFPYSVQVYKDGILQRTETFNSRMHGSEDPFAEDYQDYYNIEGLTQGAYTFVITDSCGFQQTVNEEIIVEEANFQCIPGLISGSISELDSELTFSLESEFFQNIKYDSRPEELLELRYWLEGETPGAWQEFSSLVTEPVADVESIYGKKYTLELRVKNCPSYPVCTEEVTIEKTVPPDIPCGEILAASVSALPVLNTFCPCEGGNTSKSETYEVRIRRNSCGTDAYQLPFAYKVENETAGTIIINEVLTTSSFSRVHIDNLTEDLYKNRLHITLTDNTGAVILEQTSIIPAPDSSTYVPPTPLKWSASHTAEREGCEDPVGYMNLGLNCASIPAGTVVELTEAPEGYYFKSEYDASAKTWTTSQNSTDFTVTPIASGSCEFDMKMEFTNLLVYGKYSWHITDNTGRDTIVTHIIADTQHALAEPLSFTSKKNCHGTVYYPHARVISFPFSDKNNITNLPTKFRVLKGNITGYEINGGTDSIGFCYKDSLLITKPGRYIVQSFYNPSGSEPMKDLESCTVSTDTIDYVIQTVSFDDYRGSLCADGKNSTIRGNISVFVKENSGVPPYTFSLYGGNDDSGVFLGSNNTGVFSDIVAPGADFYVRVEDVCRSSFGVGMSLSPIITTDVIFGDRNVCRGSVANLSGKMIGASHNVQYQWKGSDGFESNDRQIVTPAIHVPTVYSLEISGLGCKIFDSISVQPSDTIHVFYEDLICKGTDYDGGSEFLNSLTTAHLAAGLYNFTSDTLIAQNGGCDSIAHLSLRIVESGSSIEETLVICDNMLPILWEDTIITKDTPIGNSIHRLKRKTNGCDYVLQLNLTVNPTYNDTLSEQIICEGESVIFNGNPYTVSGYHTGYFSTCNNCDSIVTLHLTVIPPDRTELYDSIFAGESYNRYNFSLPVQNDVSELVKTYLTKNIYDCDSLVVLYLSVLSPAAVIYEGFSPNGDGHNDYFVIKNIDRYPNNHILIFNRWGNKVYEGKPYMNRWDGKNYMGGNIGSNDLPVGTYFYILDLGDGSKPKKGFIYLNR